MQSREKQPFFKPLSNLSQNEITSPSSLYESSLRQKTNQSTFHINRQKENDSLQQDQSIGSEKLSSLHAKLHQEADRIRKWKVQTEIEIKQKDKTIQETTQNVECLRKSIVELQLQNEGLSLKLQEEMGCREDIIQRINATRNMCNLLKEHSARTEERLSKCETERTELKYKEKEHLKQFEDLSENFSNLEITAKEKHDHLTNLLNIEREEKEKLETDLKENIAVTEQKLKHLESQCEEKDIEIRDVRADLRKNEDKMHDIICLLDDYKQQLTTLQDNFNRKDSLLCDSDDELVKTKAQCLTLEQEINKLNENLEQLKKQKESLEAEFKDSESTFNTQMECLTTELETCNQEINSEKERVVSFQSQLEKAVNSIEDIKSSKDIIIMEKSELECQLNSILQQKDQLETEREGNLKKMFEMNSTIEEFKLNLNQQKEFFLKEMATTDELRNQIDVLETEKTKMNDNIENLVKEVSVKNEMLQQLQIDISQQKTGTCNLNDEVANLSLLLQEEKDKLNDLLIHKRDLGDELQCVQQEVAEKDKELSLKQKELEKYSKTIKRLETKLGECNSLEDGMRIEIEELKGNLEMKLSEIEYLKENREEQDKMLNGELENKAKETSALDNKVKNLKETVSTKTKQVKELEKEVRSLKSKLTSQTKETEFKGNQIEELQEELKNTNLEKEELENQNNELKLQADNEKKASDESRKEEKQMKKQAEKAIKEKDDTVQKCEHQIAEIMATLEKYQQENQKIVSEKDKEIEDMRLQVEQSESKSKMETNDVVSSLNNKLEEVNKKLTSAENEKVAAEKKVSKMEKKLKKYENDVSKMETKVKNLQEIVDVIKSRKMENVGVQVEIEVPVTKSAMEISPTLCRTPDVAMKKSVKEQIGFNADRTPNIRVAPKTPQLNQKKMDIKTPTPAECTPVLFKTPTSKTPSSALKTPQRSILKSTERNSVIKKRRVAFESSGSESDDSSSSELMEVEIGEIDSRFKAGQKNLPLHIRPSPKLKTPEIHAVDDDDIADKSRLALQRKPRGPPVSKTPKQEGRMKLSLDTGNKENISNKYDTYEKVAPRTPNIRKTPSKPPGKFFKTSPKNRSSHKAKQKEETWFDIDSVFGFED